MTLKVQQWPPASCAALKLGNLLARGGILDSLLLPLKLSTRKAWNYPSPEKPEIPRPNLKLSRSPPSLATDNCQDANLNNNEPHSKLNCNFTQTGLLVAFLLSIPNITWKDRNGCWKKLCSVSQVQIRGSRDCGPSCGLIVQTCGTVGGTNPPLPLRLHCQGI